MTKILVTGGSGFLGSKIIQMYFDNFELIGTYNTHPFEYQGVETTQLDITDPIKAFKIIGEYAPELVIHTAAERNIDYCQKQPKQAWKTNVEGTRNIVNACTEVDAKLIFISTDMVFSEHDSGSYNEESQTSPFNYYGKTKVEAEKFVLENDQNAVVRVSLLYGWHVLGLRDDFVGWVLNSLKNNQKVQLYTDQYRNVVFLDDVAEALLQIHNKSKTGILNIAGNDCVNRFEFGKKICEIFELDDNNLVPFDSSQGEWIANRPRRCCLDVSKAEQELGIQMLGVDEGLTKMKDQKV